MLNWEVIMSLQDISLPIDVPWNLIATSNDMLARHGNQFPNAMWKSSLAVFAFNPDLADLPETFVDRELTFLKVVCSITSYSPCVKLPPRPHDPGELNVNLNAWQKQVDELKKLEGTTFPCSGALAQVAIYPKQGDIFDVSKLAYFAAFEPKKRELIEVVTESGESMTQSKSTTNIRKGITSTDSTEDKNIFTGANVGAGFEGAKVDVGIHGEWGTIKHSGSEQTDMTTHDASRDVREGASHTTSLSQLYHLLNSYHLGTNRAIFFIQPRPHTVQQKDQFTFISGPQEIEGIQEFFLVVSRPKGTKLEDYCVDALLYTAHLDPDETRASIMEPKTIETPWYELWAAITPAKKSTGLSVGDVFLAAGEIALGVPPEVALGAQALNENFTKQHPSDIIAKIFASDTQTAPDATALPQEPAMIDRYISYLPGWRVDRSRGLGGYDLWENPDNITATPLGNKSPSSAKPQAFIEIVNGTDDPNSSYRPDSRVHVRVFIWSDANTASMYHGRIKVYFIRDEETPDARPLRMFVTARGVSTCSDSPFSQLFQDITVKPEDRLEVVAEAEINPPNVAPWRNPVTPTQPLFTIFPPPSGQQNQGQQQGTITVSPPQPIKSSTPSGYDHIAIGVAHMKMANSLSAQVRNSLKASLTCTPDAAHRDPGSNFTTFSGSDYMFQRVARSFMAGEIHGLLAKDGQQSALLSFVASHPAVPGIIGGVLAAPAINPTTPGTPVVTAPGTTAGSPPGTTPIPPVATGVTPLPAFSALTLASPAILPSDRGLLSAGGIVSGLDLFGVPASKLALRLGVDEATARQVRLRVIGLDLGA
jgi:hypothetical protein